MNKELLDSLAHDKYLHYKHGFILCLFFNTYTKWGLPIVSFIAKSKEFIDGLGFGTKDEGDYVATMQGANAAIEFSKKYFNRG